MGGRQARNMAGKLEQVPSRPVALRMVRRASCVHVSRLQRLASGRAGTLSCPTMEGGITGVRTTGWILVAIGALLLACGAPASSGERPAARPAATPKPTPSASEILTKPAASSMKDMHFTATVRTTSGGQTTTFTGDGDMVVRPYSAYRLVVRAVTGGTSLTEEIITRDGTDYVRQGNQRFKASPSTQGSDVNTWRDATAADLLGAEAMSGGMAWHVKAVSPQGNPFEAWVRESDGYLIRYTATSKTGMTTFDYSMVAFNTGVSIAAPPPDQVA
jgi:outer membrane lipoprotein-sorting protein